ncbi:hypothetical protein [Demequina flava]|uniref:hypothetical protein n=1 Tax=Demequina flava TaxID=1095025 RepID=UPI000783672C|nr:hypothetical protein [Demequina flava]
MAQFNVERRGAVRLAGAPVDVTLDTIGERVGPAMDRIHAQLTQAGIDVQGAGVLRYAAVSRTEPFAVGVAFVVPADAAVPDPLRVTDTPVGMYAVARQYGAYAWIGGLTRELMEWARNQGLDLARSNHHGQDVWECWYESYTEAPVEGPEGLEGPVEIAIKVA